MTDYRYRAIPLGGPDEDDNWGVFRIRSNGQVEALYERGRGPIRLLRWDSGYVPTGHTLAKFSVHDAFAYVKFEENDGVVVED